MRYDLLLLAVACAIGLRSCGEPGVSSERNEVAEGAPPVRFRGDVTATSVVFTANVQEACKTAGLREVKGTVTNACSLVGTGVKGIIAGNPCKGQGKYARDLCHEIGHLNGWPADHGA